MKPGNSSPGMALMCNQDGLILKVLHNDLGIADSDMLGKPFPMVVARSSLQKALSFLVELRTRRRVFDWELDLSLGDKMVLAHCAGLAIDESLLIMAAQTRVAVHNLFEEMMRINNDHTNIARTVAKDRVESIRSQPERDIKLYDELSGVNNELVTLQRELAKKNIELERLNAEVQRLAIVDELTHLYNRRGFFEISRREIARAKRFGKPLSAMMFDIDHFKRVNDTYGHAVGDKVLEEVAMRCSRQLRNVDIVGRYGGEEFAVLLPEIEVASACIAAERLRHHISHEPIGTARGLVPVTISIGVAVLKENMQGLEELLEHADRALFKAKESGRNRVCVDGEERRKERSERPDE